jgi:hypothetical protein
MASILPGDKGPDDGCILPDLRTGTCEQEAQGLLAVREIILVIFFFSWLRLVIWVVALGVIGRRYVLAEETSEPARPAWTFSICSRQGSLQTRPPMLWSGQGRPGRRWPGVQTAEAASSHRPNAVCRWKEVLSSVQARANPARTAVLRDPLTTAMRRGWVRDWAVRWGSAV